MSVFALFLMRKV